MRPLLAATVIALLAAPAVAQEARTGPPKLYAEPDVLFTEARRDPNPDPGHCTFTRPSGWDSWTSERRGKFVQEQCPDFKLPQRTPDPRTLRKGEGKVYPLNS